MKYALLVFAAGSLAAAQSGPQVPAVPRMPRENPATVLGDLRASPPRWHLDPLVVSPPEHFGIFGDPPSPRPNRLGDASIDPQIILRPAPGNLGTVPPGIEIAHNQFPGLKLLPIDGNKPVAMPLSTTWPQLRIEQIPIDCGNCREMFVGPGDPSASKSR